MLVKYFDFHSESFAYLQGYHHANTGRFYENEGKTREKERQEDMMRIIITGDRDFLDYERLEQIMLQIMEKYPNETVEIVAGGDKGAESIGELFALKHYLKVARFPANWRRYGSSAGYIRNSDMIDYARQGKGILIAFWDGKSGGTKNMIQLAKRWGLEVMVYPTKIQ